MKRSFTRIKSNTWCTYQWHGLTYRGKYSHRVRYAGKWHYAFHSAGALGGTYSHACAQIQLIAYTKENES